MRKIVLNISDTTYEKLRFEAMQDKKDIRQVIHDRIFYKPFSEEVEKAFEKWMDEEIFKLTDSWWKNSL